MKSRFLNRYIQSLCIVYSIIILKQWTVFGGHQQVMPQCNCMEIHYTVAPMKETHGNYIT